MGYNIIILTVLVFVELCACQKSLAEANVVERFAWKQISYDLDGVVYDHDTDVRIRSGGTHSEDKFEDKDRFFIQYNNVPIGLEVYGDRVFITVPRRRFGIPSTLNYVRLPSSKAPVLKPYPDAGSNHFVSIYRPRVDVCGRLWAVDTGLLEVPGARTQLQKPSVVIFDLKTDKLILKYELKDSDLISERTSGGLTSITVDVTTETCDDAYAYITDLATEGLVVFSLKSKDSWRIQHQSFTHNENALNFTVAGNVINWRDGLFSVALSEPNAAGSRTAYYHPMVSFNEFQINTESLKKRNTTFAFEKLGFRGRNTQSGSHGYHAETRTIFYANAAQDAILCWRVDSKMSPENVGIAVQDHEKLVYISDLKVVGDEVWVLVNQMPRFVFSTLNTDEENYFVHSADVKDLIKGTVCEQAKEGDHHHLHHHHHHHHQPAILE